jgi:hypothetical protein
MHQANAFYDMVVMNVNVHHVDMSHLTDTTTHNSMTNSNIANAEGLMEIMLNCHSTGLYCTDVLG